MLSVISSLRGSRIHLIGQPFGTGVRLRKGAVSSAIMRLRGAKTRPARRSVVTMGPSRKRLGTAGFSWPKPILGVKSDEKAIGQIER